MDEQIFEIIQGYSLGANPIRTPTFDFSHALEINACYIFPGAKTRCFFRGFDRKKKRRRSLVLFSFQGTASIVLNPPMRVSLQKE